MGNVESELTPCAGCHDSIMSFNYSNFNNYVNWTNLVIYSLYVYQGYTFDVIIIPKDVILYRGINTQINNAEINNVQINNAQIKNILYSNTLYFADMETSFKYAFASQNNKGEQGKAVSFSTKENIILLDMASKRNLKYLHEQNEKLPDQMNINKGKRFIHYGYNYKYDTINHCFGYQHNNNKEYQLRRKSVIEIDMVFARFFETLNLGEIAGYAYTKIDGFHPEVMIINHQNYLHKHPYEYRYIRSCDKNSIYETFNGSFTGKKFQISDIKDFYVPHEMNYIPNPLNPYDTFFFPIPNNNTKIEQPNNSI